MKAQAYARERIAMVSREKRVGFLKATLTVFVVMFVLYGVIFAITPREAVRGTDWLVQSDAFPLWAGLLGGLVCSAMAGAGILIVRFMAGKPRRFKVVAVVAWPVTVSCFVFMVFCVYLPDQVYNLVKIIRRT